MRTDMHCEWSLLALIVILHLASSSFNKTDHYIESLPGLQFETNFEQYSGYLNVSESHLYHYWLVKCNNRSETVPLLLWLNGGPGCSSMLSVFTENGPYRLDKSGSKIYENHYSWNKIADVIYLDSYAGVGFSYNGDNATFSDTKTAKENHRAMTIFLTKFPEYKGRDFFITGQSYAAIYIATLAAEILNDNDFQANFVGIAIGNGVFQKMLQSSSRIENAFRNGFFNPNEFFELRQLCECGEELLCNYFQKGAWSIKGTVPVAIGNDSCTNATLKMWTDFNTGMRKANSANFHSSCYIEEDCAAKFSVPVKDYLNKMNVRKALHIPDQIQQYEYCDRKAKNIYTMDVAAAQGVYPHFAQIIKEKKRILLYSGDLDSKCPTVHAEAFIANLTLESTERIYWTYENNFFALAGFWDNYEGIKLDFVTVKGAGHMATLDKPRESLQMIANFVSNSKNYSRPITV